MLQLGYLDAGTGSMLVSALVAGAAGLGVILRLSWRRIVGFLSPRRRADERARDRKAAEQKAAADAGVSMSTGTSAEPRD